MDSRTTKASAKISTGTVHVELTIDKSGSINVLKATTEGANQANVEVAVAALKAGHGRPAASRITG